MEILRSEDGSPVVEITELVCVPRERLQKLEDIAALARDVSFATYTHTGTPLYKLKHLCIDLDCIDAR